MTRFSFGMPSSPGKVALHSEPEHLLRRLAGGQIRQQVREVLLGELDPARAAAGELRQLLAFGLALEELVGLLDHRQVGAEGGVVDLVEAEAFERRDDLAGGRHAGRQAEGLAEGHAHRRGDLGDDGLGRIVERLPDLVDLGPRRQRAGRADRGALAAVDALDLAQVLCRRPAAPPPRGRDGRSRSRRCPGSPRRSARNRRTARTCSDRAPARPTRGRAARARCTGLKRTLRMPSLRARSCSWQAVLLGQVGHCWSWLASSSSTAILRISRISSVCVRTFRPGFGRRRAGALDAAALDVHQAQPAGAVDAQVGVIAERRQVDARLADQLQQVALAVDRHLAAVDGQCLCSYGSGHVAFK